MKKKFIPLNIQLFADGDGSDNGGNENTTPPKTYTQEEYDRIIAERDKYKKANDNLSSENAQYKKDAKNKLTEEEKKAQADKEKDDLLAETRKELLGMKMTKEFLVAGFSDEQNSSIIEAYNKGDGVEFAKLISKEIKVLIENAKKEAKEEFSRSSTLPPNGTGNQKDAEDPLVKGYLERKKTNSASNARDYYLKNKK